MSLPKRQKAADSQPANSPTETPLTDDERELLSHSLRNIAAGVSATLALVENVKASPVPGDLAGCLRHATSEMIKTLSALERSSMQALGDERCIFISDRREAKKR